MLHDYFAPYRIDSSARAKGCFTAQDDFIRAPFAPKLTRIYKDGDYSFLLMPALPPIAVIVLWAGFARFKKSRLFSYAWTFVLALGPRAFRVISAGLLIYDFWLAVWVFVFATRGNGRWVDNADWPLDWLVLATVIPIGALITYFVYQWARRS
jgi:hypothetical protein